MTYSTATELYDALLKQPTADCFAHYMTKRGHTDETLSSHSGLNFVHTKMTICYSNDKQRKIPCYIRNSGSELRFSVWGKDDCDYHTQYLDTTPQPYVDRPIMHNCDFFIVLLNNHVSQNNYTVVDIDSQDELFKLYQAGFPVFDTPFTLSTTKKLPHFYIKFDKPTAQLLGEKFGRDFDLISNYVFEKKSNKVYGPVDGDLPTIDWPTMAKYLDVPVESFEFSQRWAERRKGEIRRVNKVPARALQKNQDSNNWLVDVGSKRFKPEGEVIPYMTLVRILEVLPVDVYSTRANWLRLVRATINMITPDSNANDYLRMLTMYYSKSKTYNDSWPEELAQVFIKFLNDNSYKGIGADWFYNQLKEHSPEVHTELCFHKHRDLDIRGFGKLDTNTAIKLFNDRVAFLDGNLNQFVEFNTSGNTFLFRKEAELISAYRNLYCMAKITKYTPDGTPMEKVTKSKFIKMWLDHEDRKTYRGGVCFKPPPLSAPYNQFNLFTGFDIDRNTEFDDKIQSMTKAELEHELKFILQHLRYLSGEDKTDECFAFNLRFFAHLLKYPAILPRVAIVWTSVAGVGKNQWLNFHELIMGKQYYYSSANSKELLGDFNDSIRGKLLLNLNEFKKNTEFMEAIKELITETTISTREKHKNTLRVENCSRVTLFSNNRPQILEFKARRFQVMRCSPYPASDEMRYDQQYGKQLHDAITSLYIQKCWLHYCRNYVDVTADYNFEINRVITDEYLLLRSRNIPMGLRFLRWWYVNTQNDNPTRTSKDMYQLFKLFKATEGETSMWSSSEFVNELETYTIRFDTPAYLSANIQAVIRMPKGKKQKYFYLDRERCKEFLDSENIDTSVFLEDSTDDDDEDE